ncbi:MAG: hypothetical protein IT371_20160 [Deltaproteobacteria bacterium]|nr:hypothetical protein [Deltaproteobacteria bacterium]
MATDLFDAKSSFFAGSFKSSQFVVANSAVSQCSTLLGEGCFMASSNAAVVVALGAGGAAVTQSNGFTIPSGVCVGFSIGPTDAGYLSAIAVNGEAGLSLTKRGPS